MAFIANVALLTHCFKVMFTFGLVAVAFLQLSKYNKTFPNIGHLFQPDTRAFFLSSLINRNGYLPESAKSGKKRAIKITMTVITYQQSVKRRPTVPSGIGAT